MIIVLDMFAQIQGQKTAFHPPAEYIVNLVALVCKLISWICAIVLYIIKKK